MTHSRVRQCKQWPIHQAELGGSPAAWEGLLWEGCGGGGPTCAARCSVPLQWQRPSETSSPGHTQPSLVLLGTQVLPVVATPCVVAVVGSKATKALCQGSPVKEGAPAGHPGTHRRPQPATAWLCADLTLYVELRGYNIYLRKVQLLPLVSSLPEILFLRWMKVIHSISVQRATNFVTCMP